MSWKTEAGIVNHPSGRGYTIEVTLTWNNSPYRGLVTRISTERGLKDIPVGNRLAADLALQFTGLTAYFTAKKALVDVESAFAEGQLGGLWPKCIECLNFLAIINGGIKTTCDKCGFNNPWG